MRQEPAAACAALNGPQDIVEKNRQLYHKRRDVLVESFGRAGWDIPSPRASMFAWAPLPPALMHLGSLEFSKQMLTHAKVAVAPARALNKDRYFTYVTSIAAEDAFYQSGASAGTRVAAVAPEPMTTTRRPSVSRSSGHDCGWTIRPRKSAIPGHCGA